MSAASGQMTQTARSLKVDEDLIVRGDSYLQYVDASSIVCSGSATLGSATVTGSVNVGLNLGVAGTLNVTGLATLNDENVLGRFQVAQDAHFLTTLDVDGVATVGSSFVIGNEHIQGDLLVDGNATITGTLNATIAGSAPTLSVGSLTLPSTTGTVTLNNAGLYTKYANLNIPAGCWVGGATKAFLTSHAFVQPGTGVFQPSGWFLPEVIITAGSSPTDTGAIYAVSQLVPPPIPLPIDDQIVDYVIFNLEGVPT